MSFYENIMRITNESIYKFIVSIYEKHSALNSTLNVDDMIKVWCKQESTPTLKIKLSDFDIFKTERQAGPGPSHISFLEDLESFVNEDGGRDEPIIDEDDDEPLSPEERVVHKKSKPKAVKKTTSPTSDGVVTCTHVPLKGNNKDIVCGVKVRGEGNYCGKHKKVAKP